MSLQSSMAVMKAKLAGNTPQLMALAQQGDVEAAAALKEMLDKKHYAQGVANNTAMGQPDTLPVLEQMVGNLDAPQSGLAAYAHGGMRRGFFEGGTNMTADMLNASGDGGGIPNYNPIANWFRDKLYGGKTREQYYGEEPAAPPAPAVAPTYPERAGMLHPPKGKVAKPGYTGLAAAGAPVPKKAAEKVIMAEPLPAVAGPPAAETLGDKELLAATEKLTTLQKERDALRDLSRAQLEAAYNAKVQTLTPSKFDKVMAFFAGMQEKGGRSAAQALGAGAQKMYGLEKAAKAQLGSLKEAYDKADLLEQQAMVKDRMGDVEGAMQLRKEAAELQRKIAAQKSTEKLQASQAGLADANAQYIKTIKPVVEGKKADAQVTRAARGSGSGLGGAAGIKPKDYSARVQAAYNGLKNNMAYIDKPDDELRELARQQVDTDLARAGGNKAASPAGPSVKFLGFE